MSRLIVTVQDSKKLNYLKKKNKLIDETIQKLKQRRLLLEEALNTQILVKSALHELVDTLDRI